MAPDETKQTPRIPFGRLLRVMMAGAGIFVLVVVFSASRQPQTSETGADRIARGVSGFETAFPPRPVPPALRTLAGAELPDRLVAFYWPSGCGAPCSTAVDSIAATSASRLVVVFLPNATGPVPESVRVIEDTTGQLSSYVGRSPQGLAVLYQNGSEIGRAASVDWSSPAAIRLLQTIFE